MNIYIAGPMRGKAKFNFPKFNKAAADLRKQGHVVFNPAEKDTKKYGKKIMDNPRGSVFKATKEHGFNIRHALAADTHWICLYADQLVMLPGWHKSKGAKAEHALAKALKLRIEYLKK